MVLIVSFVWGRGVFVVVLFTLFVWVVLVELLLFVLFGVRWFRVFFLGCLCRLYSFVLFVVLWSVASIARCVWFV